MKLLVDLFFTFLRIGGLTFGGGYAMLPMIKREVCQNRGWATEEEVLDCYAIGQCTPGVIAVNTATYIGYNKAGIWGGIVATAGVITPSLIIIIFIASMLSSFASIPLVAYALGGIRAAVCALVLKTVVSLGARSIVDWLCAIIFAAVFICAVFLNVSPIIPVVCAALTGVASSFIKKGGES